MFNFQIMAIGKERSKDEKMVVRQQRQRICPQVSRTVALWTTCLLLRSSHCFPHFLSWPLAQGYNVELAPQSLLMQWSERERERKRERTDVFGCPFVILGDWEIGNAFLSALQRYPTLLVDLSFCLLPASLFARVFLSWIHPLPA